jgi:NMD protein affecting ribosome stability and mRNA decay
MSNFPPICTNQNRHNWKQTNALKELRGAIMVQWTDKECTHCGALWIHAKWKRLDDPSEIVLTFETERYEAAEKPTGGEADR